VVNPGTLHVECQDMLRVTSTLLSTSFFATSGHTAFTLGSNGDTALIIIETVACVALLTALLYCKHRRRIAAE
jgi:hypothetical protein